MTAPGTSGSERPRSHPPPPGFRIALDDRVSFWADGRVAAGGSPWRVVRLAEAAEPFVAELRRAGGSGASAMDPRWRAVARSLLDRGLAHPVPSPRVGPHPVTVVVPAFGRARQLDRCLAALDGLEVVVVDDASADGEAIRRIVAARRGRLVRHAVNRGPAAARNTGVRETGTAFVAFVDSDCVARPGWLDRLMPHFDDPTVGAVAARVRPGTGAASLLARHETARSALDMGSRPELVRPGGRLGFVPSAALVVRRSAVDRLGFDEALRLGEDVDFVWRLDDAGWVVRYEPRALVDHEPSLRMGSWLRRRFEYGTSAAALARRHPGRLAPARLPMWNAASLALLAARRPGHAVAVTAIAGVLLSRRLSRVDAGAALAGTIVGRGLLADALALGHALRREWWPAGFLALSLSGRSRLARLGAGCMLAPIALEWVRHRPEVDPASYLALRLAEDAAYGSGVIVGCWRERSVAPLVPEIRLPLRSRPRPAPEPPT